MRIFSLKPILFLLFLIFIIYSNTYDAAWQLDDFPNIVDQPQVHLSDLSLSSVIGVGFAGSKSGDDLHRPLPMISFALNWFFGGNDVRGFHITNTWLHCLTAIVLFQVLWLLFETPVLSSFSRNDRLFICLLSTVLWAVNPLQTQAVTYIVQRMTVMAAFFYLLGIYFFLVGRLTSRRRCGIISYCLAVCAYLAALLSKENVVFLPLVLLIVELTFFKVPEQQLRIINQRKFLIGISIAVSILCGILLLLFRESDPWAYLKELYADRPFTLTQRLLTQPRVVFFYLSQFFYPIPDRLSIQHDFIISTSLFHPWTTLPAISFITSLFGMGVYLVRKKPMLSFAILFFLINHLIESTILPISMVYEHRNYLPTLFLYVPLVMGIGQLLNRYRYQNHLMRPTIAAFICLYIIALGMGTYLRNDAWSSAKTLWADAMKKAPRSAWPYQFVGDYYKSRGMYDMAKQYYIKALPLYQNTVTRGSVTKINYLAALSLLQKDYDSAIMWLNRLPEKHKNNDVLYSHTHTNKLVAKIGSGDIESALNDIGDYRDKGLMNSRISYLHGIVYYRAGKLDQAMQALRTAMKYQANNSLIMAAYGKALAKAGFVDRGIRFQKMAVAVSPADINAHFYLIESYLNREDNESIALILSRIAARWRLPMILEQLESIGDSPEIIPIEKTRLKKKICKVFPEIMEAQRY